MKKPILNLEQPCPPQKELTLFEVWIKSPLYMQQILDNIPKDIPLDKLQVTWDEEDGMYLNYTTHNKLYDAELTQYKKDKAKWDIIYKKYKEEWNLWIKERNIRSAKRLLKKEKVI